MNSRVAGGNRPRRQGKVLQRAERVRTGGDRQGATERAGGDCPAGTDRQEGGSCAARFVRIDPSAIELPPVESIYVARAGLDRMALRADHIARIEKYGQDLRIPPSVKVDRFDVWWVPEQGRAVCMKKGLAIDETKVIIKPEEHLGLVRVSGKGLPAASVVLLTPVGTASFATRATAIQTVPGFEKAMVVPPGDYDLWIEPADGGRSERVAEGLKVEPGKVTVVE